MLCMSYLIDVVLNLFNISKIVFAGRALEKIRLWLTQPSLVKLGLGLRPEKEREGEGEKMPKIVATLFCLKRPIPLSISAGADGVLAPGSAHA